MLKIVNFIFPVLIVIMIVLTTLTLTTLPYEFTAKKSSLLPTVGKKQSPAVKALNDYDATVERVKRSLVNLKTRTNSYEMVPKKINNDTNFVLGFNDFFENVESYNSEIELLVTSIEYLYNNPKKNTVYFPLINTQVRNLVDQLSTADLTVGKTVEKITDQRNDMQHFAMKLFAMYIYFGEDKSIKDKCRREILRFIPAVNKFANQTITDQQDIFRLTGLRLLANYGYNNDNFKKDFHNPIVQSAVENSLDLDTSKTDVFEEKCLYDDDSYLAQKYLVDYTELLVSASMFERALMGFKYPSAKFKRIEVILTKMLHPTIPYLPFGVFGFTGNRYNSINDFGWDVKGKLGVYTFPFIGLGVFKTEKFMFSLRVQRHGIPISPAEEDNDAKLSLGWLQMRKIYVNGYSYDRELTWDKLKNEPGVLTNDEEHYDSIPEDFFGSYKCENIDSFIGQLTKHKLMFWGNTYNFRMFYGECTVKEAGVVTNNGAQISYSIKNKTDKLLKFCWKDEYTGYSEHKVTGAYTEGNFVSVLPKGEDERDRLTKFTLHMMINGKEDYKVTIGSSETAILSFNYAGEFYNVERSSRSSEIFICSAKVNNLSEPSYVIAGSSSSIVNKTIELEGVQYPRDKETLMYIIKPE
ncbi:putative envelope protein ODV-E66-12 [Microplitis demolitor]|uniref:putative envelope protein ODV-E66-12 n=1 Tax=Microplitis demolitor TaxID=69319 RepID=UPI000440029D|nr:putative envelope protein ODV-E66-12 [Microplitis demolitor]KAG6558546.1 putative envelope protein ODV-E66-12 [Microplitis demolitor]